MSKKHKRHQDEPKEVKVIDSTKKCTDVAAHWERIIIQGYCYKCNKELAPYEG